MEHNRQKLIDEIKKLILLKESKIPTKYVSKITKQDLKEDFDQNGISSLIDWNPVVVNDPKIKKTLEDIQNKISELITYINEGK